MNTITLCREDRIDYKIVNNGRMSVSDAELVSLLIGEKVPDRSRAILAASDNNLNELGKKSYYDLRKMGVSHGKAINLITSFELSRRRVQGTGKEKIKIRSSADINQLLKPVFMDLQHEEFWAIYLNRANDVIDMLQISVGGVSGTVTDVRIVVKRAIELLASGLIVAHNHPSGNTNPSDSDIRITQKIKEGAGILDVQLLDHLIIVENDYYSFADNGAL